MLGMVGMTRWRRGRPPHWLSYNLDLIYLIINILSLGTRLYTRRSIVWNAATPKVALVLLSLVRTMRLPSYLLTVKHQGQNTDNYVDWHIWCRRTFVRVECESNDGILAFGRLHRPKVKARGQIRVNAAAHYSSSRQGRSRRLQFGLLGFYVADLLEGNHPSLRDKHHDDRNLEECRKSLGSD